MIDPLPGEPQSAPERPQARLAAQVPAEPLPEVPAGRETLPEALPDATLPAVASPEPLPIDSGALHTLPADHFGHSSLEPLPGRRRPAVDSARAARAALAANALRGRWMEMLREGDATVAQFLIAAQEPAGAPLLRVRLLKLLAAARGTSQRAQEPHLETFVQVAHIRPIPDAEASLRLTVGWLLDSRTGGTRVWPFMDMFADKGLMPWPGFPFASSASAAAANLSLPGGGLAGATRGSPRTGAEAKSSPAVTRSAGGLSTPSTVVVDGGSSGSGEL